MNISERIEQAGKLAAAVGAWTIIASGGELVRSGGDAIDGEGYAIARVILGIIGLAAAGLFWSGRNFGQDGMRAIMAWGVLQIPFYASAPDGNWTRQLFDIFLGASSETRINGEITDYSQVGINAMGIIVAALAARCLPRLDLWRRRAQSPVPASS
jgi:hypothetical protein